MKMVSRTWPALLVLAPILFTAGCTVRVNKDAEGHDKDVKIDTPLGGIHVNQDKDAQTSGIALYPGAIAKPDKDGDKNADVQVGFGKWQVRVKIGNYQTPDGRDKVLAFYRKALGSYGEVVECQGDKPVGTPTHTHSGLTCSDHVSAANFHTRENDLVLKSGTKHRQRMLALEHIQSQSLAGPTQFTLISLDLPVEDGDERESD